MKPAIGTVPFDEDLARLNAQAKRDRTAARLAELESIASGLTGVDRDFAASQIADLRKELQQEERTIQQFTVDENKRLRRGIASVDEIRAAIDKVTFGNTGGTFFGYGVAAGQDPVLLESITLALYKLERRQFNDLMDYIHLRALQGVYDTSLPRRW